MSLIKTTGIIAGTATVTIALGTLILSLAAPKQPQAFTLAPLAQSTTIASPIPAPTPATIAPTAPKPISTPAPKVVVKEVVKIVYRDVRTPAPASVTIAPVVPKSSAQPTPSNVCDRQCEADAMAEAIAEANAIAEEKAFFAGLTGQTGIVMSHDGDGFVNLRATPKGNVLRKMPNGTPATIVRGLKVDGKDWLLVSVGDTRGWMIGAGFEFK